ncbi:glutamine synthetase [Bowdeniella nasicola]|uniref:Glutamine synthetase n=1 Tax=Bowdeniella nasicola TaxID=208480 RepID=A0A1Q5Q3H3_9ACTO|nr:glutamine synthetase family protein [Bowdeniella nasicola]OKL54242.1 glutamine synthetase [Bowdeniella nasicola]
MDRQQEHVIRSVAEHDIRFLQLWFTDVLGVLKSVTIAPGELEGAFTEGVGFDGSAVEGLARVFEADMIARPDPQTFQVLSGPETGLARMLCDILTPEGKPARGDSRQVLKRMIAKAEDAGLAFYTHPEIEFYLFDAEALAEGRLLPIDNAGYFEHTISARGTDVRREVVSRLEAMGIPVEYAHHEGGPGQHEIDLRYADALSTADNIMTFRTVVAEVAQENGVVATFMPKPLIDAPGSGMHTHLSLFEADRNAFFDPAGQYQISLTGRRFIAGLLRHAPEFTAVTCQHVNSYKRLWGGGEAPSYICWGHNNRSALVRVPLAKPDKSQSARVEYRALDPSANPYLAFAVLLAAGLAGIEGEYDLPEGAEDDVWRLSGSERKALGIDALPSSLHRAVELFEGSELMAQTLGEDAFEFVIRNKNREWQDYRAQITQFELARFLPLH